MTEGAQSFLFLFDGLGRIDRHGAERGNRWRDVHAYHVVDGGSPASEECQIRTTSELTQGGKPTRGFQRAKRRLRDGRGQSGEVPGRSTIQGDLQYS